MPTTLSQSRRHRVCVFSLYIVRSFNLWFFHYLVYAFAYIKNQYHTEGYYQQRVSGSHTGTGACAKS